MRIPKDVPLPHPPHANILALMRCPFGMLRRRANTRVGACRKQAPCSARKEPVCRPNVAAYCTECAWDGCERSYVAWPGTLLERWREQVLERLRT